MEDPYRPLYEFGFDEHMAAVYLALLGLGRATIKQIQSTLQGSENYSYSQVYHALKKLMGLRAVELQKGFEDTFSPLSPPLLFEEFRKQKWDKFAKLEKELTDRYERATRDFGQCTIRSNRFFFSSLEMGFKIITERFLNNAKEIIRFLAPPPILLRRLQWALINAYNRGVKIEIHYSDRDFEEVPDYYITLLSLCKNFRVRIACREFRTYDAVAVNDEYTRVSSILVDNAQLISTPYYRVPMGDDVINFGIDYVEGFFQAPEIVSSIIASFPENPIQQMIEYVPPRESLLLEFLKDHPETPKHELSTQLGIGGTDLRDLLDRLVRFGAIRVEKITKRAGRPVEVVSLVGK